jgi:hypothetical protein
MAQIEVPARITGYRYNCDECGEEMYPVGRVALATNPPQYPHGCKNGHSANLTRRYPDYVVYIELQEG